MTMQRQTYKNTGKRETYAQVSSHVTVWREKRTFDDSSVKSIDGVNDFVRQRKCKSPLEVITDRT